MAIFIRLSQKHSGFTTPVPVRVRTFPVLVCVLLPTVLVHADTLYLKNGMYIVVSRAAEKDGQIEYWVGSTRYTIAKDLVAKIEPGNRPAPNIHPNPVHGSAASIQDLTRRDELPTKVASHDKLQLPTPGKPRPQDPYWITLCNRIPV
jgi:hypothetical protein